MRKIIACMTLLAFVTTSTPGVGQVLNVPAPGSLVSLSEGYHPPVLAGMKVYADDPFKMDFILDKGDFERRAESLERGAENNSHSMLQSPSSMLKSESTRLIKYFLASLTVPEDDLWVNLSPYEKDRIVPEAFGQTEMGRDLLAQDYLLKQITASVIYPEGETGKKFWTEIYRQAQEKFGTTDIPVDTFNKVWIVPEKAVVYEKTIPTPGVGAVAYVVESRLKVMLESDYLAQEKDTGHSVSSGSGSSQDLAKSVLREVVIPVLEKEVNEGRNFAPLRQVYTSLILADWYKRKVKESILSRVYADKRKVVGLGYEGLKVKKFKGLKDEKLVGRDAFVQAGVQADLSMKNRQSSDSLTFKPVNLLTFSDSSPEDIWQRYVQAFKKGAYNYIKEEKDTVSGEMIPRRYFSGGFRMGLSRPGVRGVSVAVPREPGTPAMLVKIQVMPEGIPQSAMKALETSGHIGSPQGTWEEKSNVSRLLRPWTTDGFVPQLLKERAVTLVTPAGKKILLTLRRKKDGARTLAASVDAFDITSGRPVPVGWNDMTFFRRDGLCHMSLSLGREPQGQPELSFPLAGLPSPQEMDQFRHEHGRAYGLWVDVNYAHPSQRGELAIGNADNIGSLLFVAGLGAAQRAGARVMHIDHIAGSGGFYRIFGAADVEADEENETPAYKRLALRPAAFSRRVVTDEKGRVLGFRPEHAMITVRPGGALPVFPLGGHFLNSAYADVLRTRPKEFMKFSVGEERERMFHEDAAARYFGLPQGSLEHVRNASSYVFRHRRSGEYYKIPLLTREEDKAAWMVRGLQKRVDFMSQYAQRFVLPTRMYRVETEHEGRFGIIQAPADVEASRLIAELQDQWNPNRDTPALREVFSQNPFIDPDQPQWKEAAHNPFFSVDVRKDGENMGVNAGLVYDPRTDRVRAYIFDLDPLDDQGMQRFKPGAVEILKKAREMPGVPLSWFSPAVRARIGEYALRRISPSKAVEVAGSLFAVARNLEKAGVDVTPDEFQGPGRKVFEALVPRVWGVLNSYGPWDGTDVRIMAPELSRLGCAVYDGPGSVSGKDVFVVFGDSRKFLEAAGSLGMKRSGRSGRNFTDVVFGLGENIYQHASGSLGALLVVRDREDRNVYVAGIDAGQEGFFKKLPGQGLKVTLNQGLFSQRPGSPGVGQMLGAIRQHHGVTIISHGFKAVAPVGEDSSFSRELTADNYTGPDQDRVQDYKGSAVMVEMRDQDFRDVEQAMMTPDSVSVIDLSTLREADAWAPALSFMRGHGREIVDILAQQFGIPSEGITVTDIRSMLDRSFKHVYEISARAGARQIVFALRFHMEDLEAVENEIARANAVQAVTGDTIGYWKLWKEPVAGRETGTGYKAVSIGEFRPGWTFDRLVMRGLPEARQKAIVRALGAAMARIWAASATRRPQGGLQGLAETDEKWTKNFAVSDKEEPFLFDLGMAFDVGIDYVLRSEPIRWGLAGHEEEFRTAYWDEMRQIASGVQEMTAPQRRIRERLAQLGLVEELKAAIPPEAAMKTRADMSIEDSGAILNINGRRLERMDPSRGSTNWIFRDGDRVYRVYRWGIPSHARYKNGFDAGYGLGITPQAHEEGLTSDGHYFIRVDYMGGTPLDFLEDFHLNAEPLKALLKILVENRLILADLKPQNIMILEGKAYIVDADLLGRDTVMAPEDVADFYISWLRSTASSWWEGRDGDTEAMVKYLEMLKTSPTPGVGEAENRLLGTGDPFKTPGSPALVKFSNLNRTLALLKEHEVASEAPVRPAGLWAHRKDFHPRRIVRALKRIFTDPHPYFSVSRLSGKNLNTIYTDNTVRSNNIGVVFSAPEEYVLAVLRHMGEYIMTSGVTGEKRPLDSFIQEHRDEERRQGTRNVLYVKGEDDPDTLDRLALQDFLDHPRVRADDEIYAVNNEIILKNGPELRPLGVMLIVRKGRDVLEDIRALETSEYKEVRDLLLRGLPVMIKAEAETESEVRQAGERLKDLLSRWMPGQRIDISPDFVLTVREDAAATPDQTSGKGILRNAAGQSLGETLRGGIFQGVLDAETGVVDGTRSMLDEVKEIILWDGAGSKEMRFQATIGAILAHIASGDAAFFRLSPEQTAMWQGLQALSDDDLAQQWGRVSDLGGREAKRLASMGSFLEVLSGGVPTDFDKRVYVRDQWSHVLYYGLSNHAEVKGLLNISDLDDSVRQEMETLRVRREQQMILMMEILRRWAVPDGTPGHIGSLPVGEPGEKPRVSSASEPAMSLRAEDVFSSRIKEIREIYYAALDQIQYQQADKVAELSADFKRQIIQEVRILFDALKVGKGLVLVSSGSFSRSSHVEGSDFDWYFVTDGTPANYLLLQKIQAAFKQANMEFDSGIVPRIERERLPGDWDGENRKIHDVTLDLVQAAYKDSEEIMPKIIGTLSVEYLGGDRELFSMLKDLFRRSNDSIRGSIADFVLKERASLAGLAFNEKEFDIKRGRGMLLNIHDIYWLLLLMKAGSDKKSMEGVDENLVGLFREFSKAGYSYLDEVVKILNFYLLLRNYLVKAAAQAYVHPTGYETKYNQQLAPLIASKMGMSSSAELEKVIKAYSERIVEIGGLVQKTFEENRAARENPGHIGSLPVGEPGERPRVSPASLTRDDIEKVHARLKRGMFDDLKRIVGLENALISLKHRDDTDALAVSYPLDNGPSPAGDIVLSDWLEQEYSAGRITDVEMKYVIAHEITHLMKFHADERSLQQELEASVGGVDLLLRAGASKEDAAGIVHFIRGLEGLKDRARRDGALGPVDQPHAKDRPGVSYHDIAEEVGRFLEARSDDVAPGGIDLTDMKTTPTPGVREVRFHIDPAMFERLEQAPGFVPVIMDIQPLKSFPEFFGIKIAEPQDSQKKETVLNGPTLFEKYVFPFRKPVKDLRLARRWPPSSISC